MDLRRLKGTPPEQECLVFPRDNTQAAYDMFERLRDLLTEDLSEDSRFTSLPVQCWFFSVTACIKTGSAGCFGGFFSPESTAS